ncbi:hypothetical protein [Candidatus Frankia alpina]|nr:hypothetical protein [Candidatus Frankia alpina]
MTLGAEHVHLVPELGERDGQRRRVAARAVPDDRRVLLAEEQDAQGA